MVGNSTIVPQYNHNYILQIFYKFQRIFFNTIMQVKSFILRTKRIKNSNVCRWVQL